MSEDAKPKFVDGLRVTPQHLNHLASTVEDAIHELRRALGFSIDLDCGYLRDTAAATVSGSPSLMLGLATPFVPAGIFRTWMLKA